MKRILFTLIVWIAVVSSVDVGISYADSGDDRCTVRDCLCMVRPGNIRDPETTLLTSQRRAAIYFQEDSDIVSETQAQSMQTLLQRVGSNARVDISIIGYTDGCGTREHNRALAMRRATNVEREIRSVYPNARITKRAAGENVSYHTSDARRVDIVLHTESSLSTRIERIPADVYLIDASGSMWSGWRNWTDVINASVKPGSRIYLSIMSGCRRGQNINSVRPQGGTEIWYSYWKVLEYMQPGETLLIVSDFQSNYALTRRERAIIEAKVAERGVTVYTLR